MLGTESMTAPPATTPATTMKRIVVRKPGGIRLTSRTAYYGYGMCCCRLCPV